MPRLTGMALYGVRYQAGEYSGVRHVNAEDGEQAVAMVKAKIHREMSLPMYSESYQIVSEEGFDADPDE